MIEAELKARLVDPDAILARLHARARRHESATYHDTYFDSADGRFESSGQELRVRTVDAGDASRTILTFKAPAVDEASDSKPERETTVGDAQAARDIVQLLGYRPSTKLTKRCENFWFGAGDRDFLATVVRVPEIDGTFLEVETMASEDQVDDALAAVRAVLAELGVPDGDLTTEKYTDAVRSARG